MSFLPLKAWGVGSRKTRDTPLPTPPILELIEAAMSCFQGICNFLEAFLAQPIDQYSCFTTREWFQLILTTRMASLTCFFCPASAGSEWNQFQTKSRAKMATYLKSLSQRMENLSTSKREGHPDIFAMFKSVLDLLVPKYAPPEVCPRCPSASQLTESSPSAANHDSMAAKPSSTGSSSCPMLDGSIKETEFWRASEANRSFDESTDSYDSDLSSGGGLFNGSEDWLNIFSQWVVDFKDVDGCA